MNLIDACELNIINFVDVMGGSFVMLGVRRKELTL